jgi:flagellum-specific peptidoglycan hydrolase FlgJ
MRDGEGLVVDVDTWRLRQEHVLIQSTPEMIVFLALGARAQRIQRFAFDHDGESETDFFLAHCHQAADTVERGNLHKAYGYGIPPSVFAMKDRNIRRLAIAEALARAGYDQDEPRVSASSSDGGQWTSDGDADDTNIVPAADKQDEDVEAKKQRFVDVHLADAQKTADELGVPVENILGLSALESGWGNGRFAAEGNNYFSLYSPSLNETGTLTAKGNPKAKLSTFDSYADSVSAFLDKYRTAFQGVSDPTEFARVAQDQAHFGINTETGQKEPKFVSKVAATIVGLRPYIARRKI